MERQEKSIQPDNTQHTGQSDQVKEDPRPERREAVQPVTLGKDGNADQGENSRKDKIKLGIVQTAAKDNFQKIASKSKNGKHHTEYGEKIFSCDQPHERASFPETAAARRSRKAER